MLILAGVFGCLVIYIWILSTLGAHKKHPAVTLIVVGDLGRSPRILHHAHAFLRQGYRVHLCGYVQSTLPPDLIAHPMLDLVPLSPSPFTLSPDSSSTMFLLLTPIRLIWPTLSLFYALITLKHMDYVLVQNPPFFPSLIIAQFVCPLTNSPLIIDWHNTSQSLLSMRYGPESPVTQIANYLEARFGRDAYLHLFVSETMKTHLTSQWHLRGKTQVLYDRSPSHFAPLDKKDKFKIWDNDAFKDLPDSFKPKPTSPSSSSSSSPLVLVTSTSYTPDEDLDLLCSALALYNSKSAASPDSLPPILCIVTGKGPLKASFESRIERLLQSMKRVHIQTAWLEPQDYPKLLASADLGISLHTSSSGFDLPMKIVDMFGSGLPVLAVDFPALKELVIEGKNGHIFTDASSLSQRLIDLLHDDPKQSRLESLSKGITDPNTLYAGKPWVSWDEHWNNSMQDLVQLNVAPAD